MGAAAWQWGVGVLAGAALALGQQGGAQRARGAGLEPASMLARAADADRDGATTAEELARFLATLTPAGEGALDRPRLKARLLDLDLDGDGLVRRADLEQALGERAGRGSGLLAQLAVAAGDADGDTRLSDAERGALLAGVPPDAVLGEVQLSEWIQRAEALPPQDRNALTAGVFLVSLDAAFDLDSDGALTRADLSALFARTDANSDGTLTSSELESARRAAAEAARAAWRPEADPAERSLPPRMPWQRSLEDALALVAATGKPLLICVNMDGEAASESLAWSRYRDPAFAELAAGFIALLASPDRREPLERDDRGRRLADRRFGRLVDSEHIDVEPALYERYFSGRRVAPRHVGVAPDGKVLFDLFLLQDLSAIDAKLREFGRPGAALPEAAGLGDEELLASPDAGHRAELERRFVAADESQRARLAALALSNERATQHPELVRLALRDPAPHVRRQAAELVARYPALAPLDAFTGAFGVVQDDSEGRRRLVEALNSEAQLEGPRRASLALFSRAFAGLGAPSQAVDRARWLAALRGPEGAGEAEPEAADFDATTQIVDQLESLTARSPSDLEAWVQLALARTALGRIELVRGGNPVYFLEDALSAARKALELNPKEARGHAVIAFASFHLRDYTTVVAAGPMALPGLLFEARGSFAGQTLRAFALSRARLLYDALQMGEAWDAQAVSDVDAAFDVLCSHPSATEADQRARLDFLGTMACNREQGRAARSAVARFPLSGALHEYLRFVVLRDEGSRALERCYGEQPLVAGRAADGAALDWYHGLATLVAAEHDVRQRDPQTALAAYARSLERFAASARAEPGYTDSAAHYAALAHAARARLLAERADWQAAADEAVRSAMSRPQSWESDDGLGESPVESAKRVHDALLRAGEEELAQELARRLTESGVSLPAGR